MKGKFIVLGVLGVLLLLPVVALAQLCGQGTSVAQRVYTAQRILMVNAEDWEQVLPCWAVDMQYLETVAIINGRDMMGDYLHEMFLNSQTMTLEIVDEVYGDDPGGSGDFVYSGTWVMTGEFDGMPYNVPGMSIVKFRPGEALAYYQRDYFTEGDIWINIPQVSDLISAMRENLFDMLNVDYLCLEYETDGDGYAKYILPECEGLIDHPHERDCDDDKWGEPAECATCTCGDEGCEACAKCINPGAAEFRGDGIDSNCNGQEACGTMVFEGERTVGVVIANLAVYLIPVGLICGFRRRMK